MLVLGLVVALAMAARVVELSNIPGVNGDEAWYGVQIGRLLQGQPFDWKTPSRLPLNPFYVGLQAPFLALSPPEFWILRMPSLLAGVLAPLLLGLWAARPLGHRVAAWSAGFLIIAPVMIAYARFGWDSSLTPLVGVVALGFALRRSFLGTSLAWLASWIVHPTNVLLAPWLAAPFVSEWFKRRQASEVGPPPEATLSPLLKRTTFTVLLLVVLTEAAREWSLAHGVLAQLPVPRFLGRLIDFLSGITAFRFLAGPVAELAVWTWRVGTIVVLGGLLAIGFRSLWRRRDERALSLGAALAVVVSVLFALAGPDCIQPGTDRYGMFLVVPFAVVLALALEACLARFPDDVGRRLGLGTMSCLGAVCLLGVHNHYFHVFETTGGDAHRTFHTAEIEPKQQAFEKILGMQSRSGPASSPRLVLTENWWLFWPIQFLALKHPEIEIRDLETISLDPDERQRQVRSFLDQGAVVVLFADSELATTAARTGVVSDTIKDRSQRPLILLLQGRSRSTSPKVAEP